MRNRTDYQRTYYLQAKELRKKPIICRGYIPPRVPHHYRVRERHVFSGVSFRMLHFTGRADLNIRARMV